MILDQQGFLWMSDPRIAALVAIVAVGIVVWCHRVLANDGRTGAVPMQVPVQAERRARPRRTQTFHGGPSLGCQAVAVRRRSHGRRQPAA